MNNIKSLFYLFGQPDTAFFSTQCHLLNVNDTIIYNAKFYKILRKAACPEPDKSICDENNLYDNYMYYVIDYLSDPKEKYDWNFDKEENNEQSNQS